MSALSVMMLRRVAGGSMRPGFSPGRIVIAIRPAPVMRVRVGDVVLLRHGRDELIKRISRLEADRIFVTGDDADVSSDSRDFGWLPRSAIMAKVVWPRVPAPPHD